MDLSYRLLATMQRLQTLLAVDQGPSGGYQIPGNASQRWELLDVLKGC